MGAQDIRIVNNDQDGFPVAEVTTNNALKVDGSGATQPVSGTTTANQGSPNSVPNSWPVKVTDGATTTTVSYNGQTGAMDVTLRGINGGYAVDTQVPSGGSVDGKHLLVSTGNSVAGTTLNAVTGNATGATIDFGSAKTHFAYQVIVNSGTVVTPTYTLELSLNGTAWASSGVSTTTATGHIRGSNADFVGAARYARVVLTGSSGTFNVSVLVSAS